MKKILTLGLLAVVAALGTSRSADAWTNCKFSIGLNWACQSGNNSFLWGLWHNGQVPEYDGYGGGHYNGLPPGYGPPYPPGTQPFPYFGTNKQQQHQSMPSAAAGSSTSYYHQANYAPSYQTPSTPTSYMPSYYSPSYYYPGYYYPGYGDGFSWFSQQ